MRKCMMMLLLSALLCLPAAGVAEGLEDLFAAVQEGTAQGIESGAAMALAGMEQELTLALVPQDTRIEEGRTLRLTIAAGNPRPQETEVSFVLRLPQRLVSEQDVMWTATLPAAQLDPQSGTLEPSVTTFTREIALVPGGGSEKTEISCEMNMGTRFYRANAQVELCVADVKVSAEIDGAEGGRILPGEEYAYRIKVSNGGTAPKDVALEMMLPEDVTVKTLPAGMKRDGQTISGVIRAEAAEEAASQTVLVLPVVVGSDALEGDADATRLMSGTLRADGEPVALPRVQVCGAKVNAKLLAEDAVLAAGEETNLRIVVVNSGLAPADVRLACVLPRGLTIVAQEEEASAGETVSAGTEEDEATPGEMIAPPPQDGAAPAQGTADETDGTLIVDLHMDAAKEAGGRITANTKTLEIRVKAEQAQEEATERLIGATLAWTVDGGETQLSEAVAMRVVDAAFMGITASEWNCIFWAAVLMLVMVLCLYAAVHRGSKEEDYCFD